MTTNGDVEEGGDTVGSLPPAPQPRRTLAGIEGVLSSRGFNTGGPSEGGEDGGQAGGDKPANFADYLAAQRALKQQASTRRFAPAAVEGDDARGVEGGGDAEKPSSTASFNPALLAAASRLKTKAAVAKKKVAERTAAEMNVIHALGTLGGKGAVSSFNMEEFEGLDEDGASDGLFLLSFLGPR